MVGAEFTEGQIFLADAPGGETLGKVFAALTGKKDFSPTFLKDVEYVVALKTGTLVGSNLAVHIATNGRVTELAIFDVVFPKDISLVCGMQAYQKDGEDGFHVEITRSNPRYPLDSTHSDAYWRAFESLQEAMFSRFGHTRFLVTE